MVTQPLPGNPGSYWLSPESARSYEPLTEDLAVDVAVVGAGMSGLSTAISLLEADRTVAVLEARRIGCGTSGHTTAKLTSQHGLTYERLLDTHGRSKARQYADANQAAIEEVVDRATELDADVGIERLSAYVYAPTQDQTANLQSEAAAARRLGLPAEYVPDPEGPVDMAGALRFRDQAQFHPYRYMTALAAEIEQSGGRVFEGTRAQTLDVGEPWTITTQRGTVRADNVVLSTLFPVFDRAGYFARVHPSFAYLLAAEITGSPPDGMFLSTDSPPWTFRSVDHGDQRLLIVGGQGHPAVENERSATERYRRCAAFAREHFAIESIRRRWSAHDYVSIDGMPYIGTRGPFADNVYVATGYNKWGMTASVAAGNILTGLIVDGEHPWASVFDPHRITPRSAKRFAIENTRVGVQWVAGHARSGSFGKTDAGELPDRGEGVVTRIGGRPVGVSRDETGELHAVSAICPHMWCVLEWNGADGTWDCPCHGSRFDPDGEVRTGPAVNDLPARDVSVMERK